ncbi:MAG: general secretion pathway protein GspK [Gammaproteobacteria bacterium]
MKSSIVSGRQNGIVLVIILWATVLLTVIMGGLVLAMRTEIRLALTQSAQVRARALAEAGINHVILRLLQADRRQTPSLTLLKKQYRFGAGQVQTYVEDEAGKIDLNQAGPELFDDLLLSVGLRDELRESLVEAILDFRDPDNLNRLKGLEEEVYRESGLDYGPKNARFDTVEELLQIPGMSTKLFKKVRRAITVHSGLKEVNLTLAPMSVLKAVPNQDPENLRERLVKERETPGSERSALDLDPRYAGTGGGRLFSIRAQGIVANARASIAAIISLERIPQRPYTILGWTSG